MARSEFRRGPLSQGLEGTGNSVHSKSLTSGLSKDTQPSGILPHVFLGTDKDSVTPLNSPGFNAAQEVVGVFGDALNGTSNTKFAQFMDDVTEGTSNTQFAQTMDNWWKPFGGKFESNKK